MTRIDNKHIILDNYFMSLTVKEVLKNTPAMKAGIMLNDIVHIIEEIDMCDFIDDTYVNSLKNPTVHIERNGKKLSLKLTKASDEDMGILYRENLYPDEDECLNGCLFCFVDQLPKGMRKSLYVRDDDWRYSVLYGNYITMTNMSDKDFQRVVTRGVSPLYISVHATNPEVRFQLMRNKNAKLINEQLKFLYDNKIVFHSQIVLCPGINNGIVLEKTIEDMAELYPYAKTLSIVPVGLTEHRDNLPVLKPVDESLAKNVISTVDSYRQKFDAAMGTPFVYVSDEFYSKADLEYPRYVPGEINAQKANGVGLFSDFLDEFEMAVDEISSINKIKRKVILVTGASAYKQIEKCARKIMNKTDSIQIEVIKVKNNHFGESITVAGLLTGCDIIEAVGKKEADAVFVPESALRNNEEIFLDDLTIKDVEEAIGTNVLVSPNDGYDFVLALIGGNFE